MPSASDGEDLCLLPRGDREGNGGPGASDGTNHCPLAGMDPHVTHVNPSTRDGAPGVSGWQRRTDPAHTGER
eukprot:XP_001707128.1 Hypothetical protein GL50803_31923 [Giardia lamblia ATCC 50803]